MSDREALAAALEMLYEPDFDDLGRNTTPVRYPLDVIGAAARERLAQLPKKCGTCDGLGFLVTSVLMGGQAGFAGPTCSTCHGSGKVYPAETVERIGESMRSVLAQVVDVSLEPSQFVSALDELAVAVLDALNGETP